MPRSKKDTLAKSLLSDAHFYRNIAERLATGRWVNIDPVDPRAFRETVQSSELPNDDYIMVSPVAYETIKTWMGFASIPADEMLAWNIYGYIDSGLEVRVYSVLPVDKMVMGSTPVPQREKRVKLNKAVAISAGRAGGD